MYNIQCVRACAVDCITYCLSLVTAIPRQDANIFPEYIVPSLAKLVQDPCVLVRQALAENVSTIAHTAQRFLDWSLHNGYFSSREYDVELKNLCDSLQQVVTLLIMDPSNAVKRTFMHNTHGHLWTFFGLARANDLIMTHLITYLNDNQDYQLRRDFFECLHSNALMIGPYQGDIILPLLMQCMNDSEEWVVVSSIGALIAMCKEDIFSNAQLLTVLSVTLPLLLHPNAIIRQSIVHLVCGVCELLDPVDVLASVRPLMVPYLAESHLAIDYTNELCVLSSLTSCIPRRLWRTLLSFNDLRAALDKMRAGLQHPRLGLTKFLEASMPSGNLADDKTLRRVMALGLDPSLVSAVLCLEQHLLGVHSHKRATLQGGGAAGDGGSSDDRGEIQVLSSEVCGRSDLPEIFRFSLSGPGTSPSSGMHHRGSGHTVGGSGGTTSPPDDWPLAYHVSRGATPSSGGTGPSSGTPAVAEPGGESAGSPFPPAGRVVSAAHDTAAVPSVSESALRQVVIGRHRQHQLLSRYPAPPATASQPAAQPWQPAGVLISHLHEHTARIHRLCAVESTSLFASASHDGTVRIWDAQRTDKDTPINRSKGVYGRLGSSVRSLAACPSHHSIAAASDNGNIHVFRLDKLSMLCDRVLDKEEDVFAVDMAFYDTGCGESVVVYASVTGGVVGWDLRQPGTAWRFNNGPKNGLITSLMVDRDSNFLAVGTNKGSITCWDIRFQLPITQIKHENGHHIRRLAKNPCDSRTAFAAVTGNNEVGLWELDTNYRRQTLWASPKEPLKHKEVSSKNINGVCVGALGTGEEACDVFVITGGSDCCLRYWDLARPQMSKVIGHAAIDHPSYPDASYREVRAELGGNTVIVEDRQSSSHRKDLSVMGGNPWVMPSSNPADLYDPHRPASGHKDSITDVIMVDSPQRLVVSSDAMGVVKIWK
ncbi:WD40 repeat [Trinorchestia longiramus]|nr:WD40 repeat [Trinorchestia longiramus]